MKFLFLKHKEVSILNDKLRELRLSKNLSGDDMAKLLGLSKGTYSKKENGTVKFSLIEAKRISEVFKKNIEEIFFEN